MHKKLLTACILLTAFFSGINVFAKTNGQQVYINNKKVEKKATIRIGDGDVSLDLRKYPSGTTIKISNPKVIKKEYDGIGRYGKSWSLLGKRPGTTTIKIQNKKKTLKKLTIKVRKPLIISQKIHSGMKIRLKYAGNSSGFLNGKVTWIFTPVGNYGFAKKYTQTDDMTTTYLFAAGTYKIKAKIFGKTYQLKNPVTILYSDEDFAVNKIEDAKKAVPSYIIASFKKQGYRYEVAKIGGVVGEAAKTDSSITGVHDAKEKIISVNDTSAITVIHELGHFVSCSYGKATGRNLTQTKIWEQLFKEEGKNYEDNRDISIRGSSYASSDVNEFFAECFQLYCLRPKQLQKCCPNTYKEMKKVIETDLLQVMQKID